MAALTYESFDVVIYDSPNGHTAGSVLYSTSDTTGGSGYGWNDMAVNFTFTAGDYYVVNWRPTDGGSSDWVVSPGLDYYHDDGLPYTVGPITIVEGFEGFNAEDPTNFLHPHLRFCVGTVPQDCDHCFDDSYGFRWCLDVIDTTSGAVFFSGTVDMGGGEVRNAVATYLKPNKGMSFFAGAGTGVPFNYNLVAKGGLRGCWINLSPTAGHGGVTATKVPCSSAPEYGPEVEGPIPGAVEP
jgi:hypothetical protein